LFCRKSFDLRQKKIATAFFIATAGLVLAQVLDPDTAQRIAGTIAGLVPLTMLRVNRPEAEEERVSVLRQTAGE
jgi:hypothetical protein